MSSSSLLSRRPVSFIYSRIFSGHLKAASIAQYNILHNAWVKPLYDQTRIHTTADDIRHIFRRARMSLIHCPDCHHLTFSNAASCPSCGEAFQPGALLAIAKTEEKSFRRKSGALFFAALLLIVAVSLFMILRT
jgi:hypothetical protein